MSEVPFQEVSTQQVISIDGTVITSTPLQVWKDKQLNSLKKGALCGFAGHTSHDTKFNSRINNDVYLQFTIFRKCFDLTFTGQIDDYYVFELPCPHPGDIFFEGCSGAPIIDQNGNVVALVSHGRVLNGIMENYVYGVPIDRYRLAMDANRLLEQWQAGGKPYLDP